MVKALQALLTGVARGLTFAPSPPPTKISVENSFPSRRPLLAEAGLSFRDKGGDIGPNETDLKLCAHSGLRALIASIVTTRTTLAVK